MLIRDVDTLISKISSFLTNIRHNTNEPRSTVADVLNLMFLIFRRSLYN